MGQALYRKYRPKKLSDVVGQEHITSTLERAIKSGRISHAYLFTGPRGVGKTSIARILAHEINSLPYKEDAPHLDIIEIDAASNRRIDEIRELREKVYVAPTSAKYKVYIIDEVHMLTREAFNALLKTLEEPPMHAVFILATTDAHKLPETIVSRTQRFSFRPVESNKVAAHLKMLASQEKIQINDDALALLAEHGEGSFRDSISLLDQASNHGKKLELADVQNLLGIPPEGALNELLANMSSGDSSAVMRGVLGMYEQGYQAAGIAKQLGGRIRSELTAGKSSLDPEKALQLLAKLIEVPASHDPERYLEIVLLETSGTSNFTVAAMAALPKIAPTKPLPSKKTSKETVDKAETVVPEPLPASSEASGPGSEAEEPEESVQEATPVVGVLDLSIWPQVLDALKKKHNTVYSIARMGQPSFNENGTLQLAFAFAFHQKRINDAKNRKLLADTIKEVTGQNIVLECVYDKELAKNPAPNAAPVVAPAVPDPALSTISNIFGGGELLES